MFWRKRSYYPWRTGIICLWVLGGSNLLEFWLSFARFRCRMRKVKLSSRLCIQLIRFIVQWLVHWRVRRSIWQTIVSMSFYGSRGIGRWWRDLMARLLRCRTLCAIAIWTLRRNQEFDIMAIRDCLLCLKDRIPFNCQMDLEYLYGQISQSI